MLLTMLFYLCCVVPQPLDQRVLETVGRVQAKLNASARALSRSLALAPLSPALPPPPLSTLSATPRDTCKVNF